MVSRVSRVSRFTVRFCGAALLAAVVAGCANEGPPPPCPNVRIDSATAKLVKFREGPGRDVTDVEYQAQVGGYKGECIHRDDSVDVIMDIDFAFAGGPAAQAGDVSLYYFIAIPQYFPQPEGKRIIEIKHKLSGRTTARERISETGVKVTIPLKPEEPAAAYDIYIGLQLTNEQLEFNRAQAAK